MIHILEGSKNPYDARYLLGSKYSLWQTFFLNPVSSIKSAIWDRRSRPHSECLLWYTWTLWGYSKTHRVGCWLVCGMLWNDSYTITWLLTVRVLNRECHYIITWLHNHIQYALWSTVFLITVSSIKMYCEAVVCNSILVHSIFECPYQHCLAAMDIGNIHYGTYYFE